MNGMPFALGTSVARHGARNETAYAMPRVPEGFDWDLESPGSRFTRRIAFAVLAPEAEWDAADAAASISRRAGDWVLEEQDELGTPDAVEGGIGRGAEGWAPIVEWALEPAVKGVVSFAAAAAAKKVWDRLRNRDKPPAIVVSRGLAVALAADAVAREFGDRDLEVEAADEPPGFAGFPTSEINYIGLFPWVVFLIDRDRLVRYIVVVSPGGEVIGMLRTEMLEYEAGYLPPSDLTDWGSESGR
jgi:hypothetical protein